MEQSATIAPINSINILEAFSTPPDQLDFVLPGLVRQTVGSLICAGGGGKSMLILQLCAAIAMGEASPICPTTAMKPGKCLLIPAEDMQQTVASRLFHLAMTNKLSSEQMEKISNNVKILDILGSGVSPNLCHAEENWVETIAEEGKDCRLIVLDTLRRFHLLDENSGGDMAFVVGKMEQIAYQTGAAVVFLHHTNKGAALSGGSDLQQASRGSSVLVDNIRWQAYLSSMSRDESEKFTGKLGGVPIGDDRGYYVRYGVSKQNYGPPLTEIWLKRGDGGILSPVTIYPVKRQKKNHGEGL